MLDLIWNNFFVWIIPFLGILTVLVFIHEMGHYLVARWSGVRVMAFSVGFGPELFGFNDKNGTRWKFCLLPLGGYVRMYGDLNAASAVDPAIANMTAEERDVAFPFKPLYKRAAIVAAGPFANFLLAWIIFAAGYSLSGVTELPSRVGHVEKGSAADLAGFQAGDTLLTVNGKTIETFRDYSLEEQVTAGDPLKVDVARGGQVISLEMTPERVTEFGPTCRKVTYNKSGISGGVSTQVDFVATGSAADAAGLVVGDTITHFNQQPVAHFNTLRALIVEAPGEQVQFSVQRDGQRLDLPVTLGVREMCDLTGEKTQQGVLGIRPVTLQETRSVGFGEAATRGLSDMYSFVVVTFRAIGQIFVGKRGTEDLGGPIRIANMVGEEAKVGITQLVVLTAILSLNLGLINLFPIPVLDGGHLALYGIEAVRRKPLSAKAQDFVFRIGFFLIMSLMLFLVWNDLKNTFL